MAIDQIAQFGLSSIKVIYYFAKLFRATVAPIFHVSYIWDALIASKPLFSILLTENDTLNFSKKKIIKKFNIPYSIGTLDQLEDIRDLVGPLNYKKQPTTRISGWIVSQLLINYLSLYTDNQQRYDAQINYYAAPDVTTIYPR